MSSQRFGQTVVGVYARHDDAAFGVAVAASAASTATVTASTVFLLLDAVIASSPVVTDDDIPVRDDNRV